MPDMDYVRIVTGADGETHFEDVAPAMVQERYADASWAISEPVAVSSLRFRRVDVDYPDEPHVAPRRQVIVFLRGGAEVEVSDGEVRRFGPGDVLVVEDVTGKGHTTRGLGDVPRETLFLALD